jgi:hypothetical protein
MLKTVIPILKSPACAGLARILPRVFSSIDGMVEFHRINAAPNQ